MESGPDRHGFARACRNGSLSSWQHLRGGQPVRTLLGGNRARPQSRENGPRHRGLAVVLLADSQRLHFGVQRRPFQTQPGRRAGRPADFPSAFAQRAENLFPAAGLKGLVIRTGAFRRLEFGAWENAVVSPSFYRL